MISITKARYMFLSKQFMQFIIIGCINSMNGIIFSYLYAMIVSKVTGFILGYITSLVGAYILNSYFTFKEKLALHKFIKFCLSYIPNFIIQFAVVVVGLHILHLNQLIAYSIAAAIGVPVTFFMLKIFVFVKKTYES
jgi:putative flippase GtrA